MNNKKADLNWYAGPEKTLINDDTDAITAMYGIDSISSITYKHFNSRIRDLARLMYAAGIRDKHRVLIVGDNDDIIEAIAWTWAAIQLGASPGNASTVESDEDIQLKAGGGNCDAIVYAQRTEWNDVSSENINTVIGFDEEKGGKSCPEEKYILYSSGTTKKAENKFGVEPQFFTFPEKWTGGIAHTDQLRLAERFLGDVPINEIACHGWEVAYAPHNVVQCLLTGGTFHWVASPELMPQAQKFWNTNLMSNYPLSYDPVCEAFGNMIDYGPIEFVEVAGGICTPELIRKLRETINPRIISNSYISSKSGTILSRTIDYNDDPEECMWMENPHLDHTLRLRLDDSNVLWYKRNDCEWLTDGDVFERKGKQYRVVGKATEEYIQTRFAKINTWEIEQFANQLTRTVWGCGEHTYCFALTGYDGAVRHALVYSGPLDIEAMKERMDKMEPFKRPVSIFRVEPEFWSLNIKISRDYMQERLEKNSEYILNEL